MKVVCVDNCALPPTIICKFLKNSIHLQGWIPRGFMALCASGSFSSMPYGHRIGCGRIIIYYDPPCPSQCLESGANQVFMEYLLSK